MFPPDLLIAHKYAYAPSSLTYTQPVAEAESAEYGACRFTINNLYVAFRVAKITPTKVGHFVTLWKRTGKGPIMPLDNSDNFDVVIISVRKGDRLGQFVFPKSILCAKDIVSQKEVGGKRGFRVYPPWDIAVNQQAKKSQSWQCTYFFEINQKQETDNRSISQFFHIPQE